MSTLTITIDPRTEADLNQMSEREGTDASLMAARLLARAVRAARPHPVYDIEELKAKYTDDMAAEDLALSEATVAEHAKLLAQESP
jgi:hypothetical protein